MPESPIIISPAKLFFPSKGFVTNTELDIYNKTDEFLYQSWIKIVLPSSDIEKTGIDISLESEEGDSSLETSRIKIGTQMYQIRGIDGSGSPFIYIVMEKIKPKSSRLIHVKIDGDVNSGFEPASVYLTEFSGQPAAKGIMKKSSESDKVYFSFKSPDIMKIESISALMTAK